MTLCIMHCKNFSSNSARQTQVERGCNEWLEISSPEVAIAGSRRLLRQVGRGHQEGAHQRAAPRIVSSKPEGKLKFRKAT
jgi:hypothetical protein